MNIKGSPIQLSGGFTLRPYTYDEAINNSKTDAQTFDAFVTDDIRTFLPGLPVFSGMPADAYFSTLPKKIDFGAGIAYRFDEGDSAFDEYRVEDMLDGFDSNFDSNSIRRIYSKQITK